MKRAWLLLGLLSATLARADEAAAPLAKIQKMFPLPQGAIEVRNLHDLQNSALLLYMLSKKYPGEKSSIEAARMLGTLRERLPELKKSLLAELPPKEAATKAALARAQELSEELRREVRAKARSGNPPLRKGECLAIDYGAEPSLYRLVVVKVDRVIAGGASAKLVYRAKEGDATAGDKFWSDFLEHAKSYEVSPEVFAGGAEIPCARGAELVRRFAAARVVGQAVAPIRQSLEKVDMILAMTGGPVK